MRKIKQALSFTLLATFLAALAPVVWAETLHLSEKQRAQKILSDPRVPITFGTLGRADEMPPPKVRIPEPRRR